MDAMSAGSPMMQMWNQNIQQGQQAIQRLRGLGSQEAGVGIAQRWAPKFEHGQGGGGFLHNLGQALMAVGAATRPGQNIVNSMYARDLERRTQEIEGIKAQEKPEEEQVGFSKSIAEGAGGLAYKQGMLATREEANDIRRQHEESYSRNVDNHLRTALQGIDLKRLALGEKTEMDKARIQLGQVRNQISEEANKIRSYGIDANNATRMAIGNVMAQLGMDKSHPVMSMVDELFGTDFVPKAPQTEAGAQPVAGQTPLPARTPPKAPSRPEASKAAPQAQYKEGQTAIGPNNHRIVYKGGKWVDAPTSAPVRGSTRPQL
jgi:hypothetical protein